MTDPRRRVSGTRARARSSSRCGEPSRTPVNIQELRELRGDDRVAAFGAGFRTRGRALRSGRSTVRDLGAETPVRSGDEKSDETKRRELASRRRRRRRRRRIAAIRVSGRRRRGGRGRAVPDAFPREAPTPARGARGVRGGDVRRLCTPSPTLARTDASVAARATAPSPTESRRRSTTRTPVRVRYTRSPGPPPTPTAAASPTGRTTAAALTETRLVDDDENNARAASCRFGRSTMCERRAVRGGAVRAVAFVGSATGAAADDDFVNATDARFVIGSGEGDFRARASGRAWASPGRDSRSARTRLSCGGGGGPRDPLAPVHRVREGRGAPVGPAGEPQPRVVVAHDRREPNRASAATLRARAGPARR